MCGIVGLFTKNPQMEQRLGSLLAGMLVEMTDRGPDSAGVAVYGEQAPEGVCKVTLFSADEHYDWKNLGERLMAEFGHNSTVEVRASHAVLQVPSTPDTVEQWVGQHYPELRIMSSGDTITIFKEKGSPVDVIKRFKLDEMQGTHALGHTRMATESAVTTAHSHPFSTGLDLCLVHNGSLSNHNRLRRMLRRRGVEFQTDNDSEVAAGYLTWRLAEGATLDQALESAIEDLDGFYTFAIGTRDGFAVLRDPIACKPAVLAETDDWVAMASEFRAIASLPGVEQANIWEPKPAKIYSWHRKH
ncbi:MAG: glutamine amidotransferase family protein [Gammaproteobacteria bacterium]|nr:glutamine amidotransferase family protein [Gammaproteobacteria bacterium]